jgi:hypothetical protein
VKHLGVGGPDDVVACFPQLQAQIDVVEGDREVFGIEAADFIETTPPHQQAGGGDRRQVLRYLGTAAVSSFLAPEVLVRMSSDAADAQYDAAMLHRTVGVEQSGSDGSDIRPDGMRNHFTQPAGFDHWDTMRDSGFLSNRLFDGSAAGAFIITDEVRGLATVFGDAIETAANATELKEKVDYYLANPAEAEERARRARSIVLAGHTFDHRAEQIIETYRQLTEGAASGARHAHAG